MTDRLCAWCGEPLVRHPNELRRDWEIRKFCGRSCAGKARVMPCPVVDNLPSPAELRATGLSSCALAHLYGCAQSVIWKALRRDRRNAPIIADFPVIIPEETKFPELGRYAFQDVTAADCALLRSLPWPVVEHAPPTYACLTVPTKRYREGAAPA